MSNLTESASWDAGIYQIETGDTVFGGASGVANSQAKSLANRTTYLKAITDLLSVSAMGMCRLSVTSATQITLARFGGSAIYINGSLQQIPSGGVTAANAGLSASTLYYVYVYLNAGVMALELSTTGHATHATGIEVKSGDASRTLIGMLRTDASSQFVTSTTTPALLNWFNRRDVIGLTSPVLGSTTSASLAELTTSARVTFLAWADEAVEITVIGSASNSASGNITHTTSAGLDGAAYGAQTSGTTFTNGVSVPALGKAVAKVSEGSHVASGFGSVSSGTGSWNFGVQVKTRG